VSQQPQFVVQSSLTALSSQSCSVSQQPLVVNSVSKVCRTKMTLLDRLYNVNTIFADVQSAGNVNDFLHCNALAYVAGYIAHRIHMQHKCDWCASQLCKPGELTDVDLTFMHLKSFCAGEFGYLKVPSDSLLQYLRSVEMTFVRVFPEHIHQRNVMNHIVTCVHHDVCDRVLDSLCPTVKDRVTTLYITVRLFSELKSFLNNAKRSKKCAGSSKRCRKLIKIQHK